MSQTYSQLAARIRVPLGMVLALIYLLYSNPTPRRLAWGAAVALGGLLLRAAAAGNIEKNQALATGGPYSYLRHPLYAGSALAGLGYCIAGGRWWFFLLLGLFLAFVYWPVIRREEAHLSELFPEEHERYAHAAPSLLPWRRARWKASTPPGGFRWKLYWKNREYEAALAYLAIVLVLLLKACWL